MRGQCRLRRLLRRRNGTLGGKVTAAILQRCRDGLAAGGDIVGQVRDAAGGFAGLDDARTDGESKGGENGYDGHLADDWHDPGRRRIGLVFGDEHPDRNGPILLMHLNAHDAAFRLVLPHHPAGWELLVDTAGEPRGNVFTPLAATAGHELQPRSLVLFRSRSRTDP